MAAAIAEPGSLQVMTGFGRLARSRSVVVGPVDLDRLRQLIARRPPAGLLARGAGLSYGDAAQNSDGIVLAPVTTPGIAIDDGHQTVTATASTTFARILAEIVPAGYILPVLPGTGQLTIGGAVAADVHGKNHRQGGSLSAWIEQVELVDGTGEVRQLSHASDAAALRATVGGMGLTGIVLSATIRLRRIDSDMMAVSSHRAASLDAVLSHMSGATAPYSVAWIDGTATGRSLGRGIVELADHASGTGSLRYQPLRPHRLPGLPVPLITPLSARAFNGMWFAKAPKERSGLTDLGHYFHRLDTVQGWNRAAGPRGLIQYQFVVPDGAEGVLAAALVAVQRNSCAPFLVTLKRFGVASGGPLSFAAPGWCLAIDMPAGRPALGPLLTWLDIQVADAGGRVYLAKDARLSRYALTCMYPDLADWRATRQRLDPRGVFQSDLGRRVGLC